MKIERENPWRHVQHGTHTGHMNLSIDGSDEYTEGCLHINRMERWKP